MGWGELGMQRDEGFVNVANTRARRLFIHFCSNNITGDGPGTLVEQITNNKITKTGPGTLVEQITKSSANEKAGEAVRVPYLIEMVNERAQARQVYDVSSARFTKLSSTMPSLVIPPKNDQADEDGWSDSQATAEEDAKAEAAKAKEDAVKADAAKKAAAKEEAAKKAKAKRTQLKRTQPAGGGQGSSSGSGRSIERSVM
ncbi:MAG: hypothetical protein Q9198_002680 [Flavoplaca austrocitrina]